MKRNKKQAAAFVTAIFMTLNFFPSCLVYAEDTVQISTVSDFLQFTEKCVYDDYSKNKTFVLSNDIDLAGADVKSAGVFCGTFEGGGHSIKNFKLSGDSFEKGLFASVTKDAQIKDLNVTGEVTVTQKADTASVLRQRASSILGKSDLIKDDDDSDIKSAGGIVGYNEGKIINCSFSGKIKGKKQVGGIAGYNSMTGVIDSCANGAQVTGDSEAGGIAGYNEGRIKLSKNTGAICSEADENTVNIGGIAGNNKGALVICTNDGAVGGDNFGDNVGGISGTQSGEIRECINNGAVKGRRSVGGIAGRFEPYTDIELSYESAKAALENQAKVLKDDLNNARSNLIDYAADLISGDGIISSLLSALGVEKGGSSSRLNNLNDAAVNMLNGTADSVSSLSESLSSLSGETKDSLREVSDSLDNSLSSLDDFLGEFDGKGQEISDTLDNLNEALDKGSDDVDEIRNSLSDRLDDMGDDIDSLTDKLDSTHDNLSNLIRQLRYVSGDASDLIEDLDVAVINVSTELRRIRKTIDNIEASIKNIVDDAADKLATIKPLLPTRRPITEDETYQSGYEAVPDENLDSAYDVEPSVVGKALDTLFVTAYAEDEKTAISDLRSIDISIPRLIGGENADTALIRYSINNGEVKATEMAGGITGSMGFESTVRQGENITLPDGTKVNADSVLKAVTDACISFGNITVNSDYAGGACGKSDIGNIKNTLTTGEITSENGKYIGGTAGESGGSIENCIAVNDIDGEEYIGGIAGSGKEIINSYALPRFTEQSSKSGAIAGFITENVSGCYFIDEGLSGVGGANLEGRAQAVKPQDIASSDGEFPIGMQGLPSDGFYMASGDLYMPQIKALAQNNAESIGAIIQSKSSEMAKFRFNVLFIDKGRELRSMTVDYGTVISDIDIPKLTADGQEVPAWDKDVHSPIIRHTKFTAEYNKATTTISTSEEPPILLAESVFDKGTEVFASEEDVSHEFNGYKKGMAYSFMLSKSAYDVIKVHIRDENKNAAKIAVQENGKWTLIDCKIDGSYAVFEVGAPCEFVILYRKAPVYKVIAMIGGAAVLAAGVFIVLRRIKKHGRKEKKDV